MLEIRQAIIELCTKKRTQLTDHIWYAVHHVDGGYKEQSNRLTFKISYLNTWGIRNLEIWYVAGYIDTMLVGDSLIARLYSQSRPHWTNRHFDIGSPDFQRDLFEAVENLVASIFQVSSNCTAKI